jgi:hypothetical protein
MYHLFAVQKTNDQENEPSYWQIEGVFPGFPPFSSWIIANTSQMLVARNLRDVDGISYLQYPIVTAPSDYLYEGTQVHYFVPEVRIALGLNTVLIAPSTEQITQLNYAHQELTRLGLMNTGIIQ